jgi:hypothetical protein
MIATAIAMNMLQFVIPKYNLEILTQNSYLTSYGQKKI